MESECHWTKIHLGLPLFQYVSNRIPKVLCMLLAKSILGEKEPVPLPIQRATDHFRHFFFKASPNILLPDLLGFYVKDDKIEDIHTKRKRFHIFGNKLSFLFSIFSLSFKTYFPLIYYTLIAVLPPSTPPSLRLHHFFSPPYWLLLHFSSEKSRASHRYQPNTA